MVLALVGGVAHAEAPAVADELVVPADVAQMPIRKIVPVQQPVAPDIAALGKQLAGKWTCKGVAIGLDGSSKPVTTKLETKLVLDDAWIQSTGVATTDGRDLKFTTFVTYDAIAKEWTTVVLTSLPGRAISTSLGEQNGTWMWTGSQIVAGAALEVRQVQQFSKTGAKFWTDAKLGGKWQKVSESTCAK